MLNKHLILDLSDEELKKYKEMSDDDLLRSSTTLDFFSVAESSRRLRDSISKLQNALHKEEVAIKKLTVVLVILTVLLVLLTFFLIIGEITHWFRGN